MAERIFDEKTLRKLERLTIVANKVRAGAIKGERRSTKRGTSIEFADYRNYVRGDDLRRVDWNVFARLDRPYIKLLEDEEDLAVHLLLDASGSMDWPRTGERGWHKFVYARQVLAGLAYIALSGGDQVTVSVLRGDGVQRWGPLRGRGQTLKLLAWLADQHTRGAVDLGAALEGVARQPARAGIAVVIGDLLSPGDYERGLRALQGRGHEVTVLQILSPDEVDPPLMGDFKLVDIETGIPQDVTIDEAIKALYRQRLEAWQAAIDAYCTRRGIHYLSVATSTPWEQLILAQLRHVRVVH